MKPSLKQISQMTGFSIPTVSNALSGKPGVNPKTAEVIMKAAVETGYLSARIIRRVKLVMLRTTGKIFDATPFFSFLIEGVSAECIANGYDMSFLTLDVNSPSFPEQMQKLQSDINSAIILIGSEITGTEYRYFDGFSMPIITLDYWCPNQRYNCVEINNFDSAWRATQSLVDQGHTRIGYLRGELRIRAFLDRERGYRACLRAADLSPLDAYTFTLGTGMERAYTDMLALLGNAPDMPTAFFADDDIIALGAIKALQERGFRVPGDISVIGFDDLPYCTISVPSLTSMNVPARQMGCMVVHRLKEVMEHHDSIVSRIQVCATLVERGSTARAK